MYGEDLERSAVERKQIEIGSQSQNGTCSQLKHDISCAFHVGLAPTVEKLLYLLVVEAFVLFIVFTHYPYLDNHNRFLTPLVMGALTSFMGQTLTSLFKWIKACGTTTEPALALLWRNHGKFLLWGATSGVLASYWIDFLVATFPEARYICVILDQTVATFTFQWLFVVFSGVWDAEFANAEPLSWSHSVRLWWSLVKLSYLVWPYVSVFCFTWAPPQWIFPINCLFGTLFSVVLALTGA